MKATEPEVPSWANMRFKHNPAALPAALVVGSLLIGFFFMRPNMGEPDSYREALSALKYLDESTYSSYWDHPLTMYFFVVGTRVARAISAEQATVLNTLAVLFGAASIWPFFQLVAWLVNRKAALFASIALIISPTFLEFSAYLSHEIIGFAFALWAVYFFQRVLDHGGRAAAILFGCFFAATWCARPSGVFFISMPLLILFLFHVRGTGAWRPLARLSIFAAGGAVVCLAAVYRPALVQHLASYSSDFLFTYYELGRYYKSSFFIALSALTPALLALGVLGLAVLLFRRKYLLVFLAGSWIASAYVFYSGMYSMNRYFLVLLPPALLLVFSAGDELDEVLPAKWKSVHPAKAAALLIVAVAALGPNLSELLYARHNDDDKQAATEVGRAVGRNLLFTTAAEPMILYYNRENPPETVYLVTEYSPGKVVMKVDMLRLAQQRLREGRPVFLTQEIIPHFRFVQVDAQCEPVFEYRFRKLNRNIRALRLFRLTELRIASDRLSGSG